jgi:hypothetical protein
MCHAVKAAVEAAWKGAKMHTSLLSGIKYSGRTIKLSRGCGREMGSAFIMLMPAINVPK